MDIVRKSYMLIIRSWSYGSINSKCDHPPSSLTPWAFSRHSLSFDSKIAANPPHRGQLTSSNAPWWCFWKSANDQPAEQKSYNLSVCLSTPPHPPSRLTSGKCPTMQRETWQNAWEMTGGLMQTWNWTSHQLKGYYFFHHLTSFKTLNGLI